MIFFVLNKVYVATTKLNTKRNKTGLISTFPKLFYVSFDAINQKH